MEETVSCPYCDEPVEVNVDENVAGEQRYVEDCWVCCQPMQVVARATEEGELSVMVYRLDE